MKGYTRIGVLFLVLAIALAGLGIGFAHWSDTLYIDGTVDTAEVDAEWVVPEGWSPQPGCILLPDYTWLDDSCSSVTTWVDPADPHRLWVEVDNAYPGANYFPRFQLRNSGSVGWFVSVIDRPLPQAEWYLGIPSALLDLQLEPGESIDLYLHIGTETSSGEVAEGTTYTFWVGIEVEQWKTAPEHTVLQNH